MRATFLEALEQSQCKHRGKAEAYATALIEKVRQEHAN